MELRIALDTLQDGENNKIECSVTPQDLELDKEEGLSFLSSIDIQTNCYLADEYLMIQLQLKTEMLLPCSLCCHLFPFPIDLHANHEEPLTEIKKGQFVLNPLIRETLFLEIPFFPQCGGDECLHREEIEKFLTTDKGDTRSISHLFQNIDI